MTRSKSTKSLAKQAKRAGITKAEFIRTGTEAIDRAAAEEQWRPSERAASIGDIVTVANEVWGQ